MDTGLRDRVALVTGGSRGIGAAIVRGLDREGCRVALTRFGDQETVEAALTLDVDVADWAAAVGVVDDVRDQLGGLDILICNAGTTADAVAWKMEEEEWDRVLAVNLKGCFNYCRAVAPHLRAQGRGRIVNISSINGMRGKFGQTNYAASKGGMIALTKALARELGPKGINVNVVAPGMVATEMIRELPEEFRRGAEDEAALGRIATPEDIANVVVFLCSDLARHITGEVVRVDGGQYI